MELFLFPSPFCRRWQFCKLALIFELSMRGPHLHELCPRTIVKNNFESCCKYCVTCTFAHIFSLIGLLRPARLACALSYAPLRSFIRPLNHPLPSLWESEPLNAGTSSCPEPECLESFLNSRIGWLLISVANSLKFPDVNQNFQLGLPNKYQYQLKWEGNYEQIMLRI